MRVEVQTEGVRQTKTLSEDIERTTRLAFGSVSARTRFVRVSLGRSQKANQETCCHVFVCMKTSEVVLVDYAGVDVDLGELVRGALRRAVTSARRKLCEIEPVVAGPQSSLRT